jgi:hypothetical protein
MISPSAPTAWREAKLLVCRQRHSRTLTLGDVRIPSVLQCGLLILVIKTVLKTCGFGWTLRWVRRRVQAVQERAPVDPEVVNAAERAVAMAGALYPGRARCLEQSLVLYTLLRGQGVPVRYCQGVQPYPFQAHAWVEYQGEIVNDVPEHAKQFLRLPDQLP